MRIAHVVVVVTQWLLHGLSHFDERSKVHDGFNAVGGDGLHHAVTVRQVSLHQPGSADGGSMTLGEIVVHHGRVALPGQ